MSTIDQLNQLKRQLRQQLRSKRQALNPAQQLTASQHLANTLIQSELLNNAQHIALYLANDGEIDPYLVLEQAVQLGKYCYLPVLSPTGALNFAAYQPGDPLSRNSYGIPEPHGTSYRPAEKLDLVLMPLVGFDRHGGRLGMGGGFYDKTFAWLNAECTTTRPKLLGLAHHCQEVQKLELANWDIPLSAVATDKGLIVI